MSSMAARKQEGPVTTDVRAGGCSQESSGRKDEAGPGDHAWGVRGQEETGTATGGGSQRAHSPPLNALPSLCHPHSPNSAGQRRGLNSELSTGVPTPAATRHSSRLNRQRRCRGPRGCPPAVTSLILNANLHPNTTPRSLSSEYGPRLLHSRLHPRCCLSPAPLPKPPTTRVLCKHSTSSSACPPSPCFPSTSIAPGHQPALRHPVSPPQARYLVTRLPSVTPSPLHKHSASSPTSPLSPVSPPQAQHLVIRLPSPCHPQSPLHKHSILSPACPLSPPVSNMQQCYH